LTDPPIIEAVPVQGYLTHKNNCLAEMWSGSEEGSYLRLIDFFVSLNSGLENHKEEKGKVTVQGYLAHEKTPTPLGPP